MIGRAGIIILLLLVAQTAMAQQTHDLGLPPPSGSQNPVLPPPSGSQNPVLPPPSGQRYDPGIGGRFGGSNDIPGLQQRPVGGQGALRRGSGELGLVGSVTPAESADGGEPLARLDAIGPAIARCWSPPPLPGDLTGAMVTVRFSLRRDGTLFGQPRIAWETRRGDAGFQNAFAQSAIAAVERCTPMRLSKDLGASIAGRPFTLRFHGRVPSNERQS